MSLMQHCQMAAWQLMCLAVAATIQGRRWWEKQYQAPIQAKLGPKGGGKKVGGQKRKAQEQAGKATKAPRRPAAKGTKRGRKA